MTPPYTAKEKREKLIEWNGSICNKIVNGECFTRKCLVRGGWDPKRPETTIGVFPTCEALETVNALREVADTLVGLSPALPKAVLDRERHLGNILDAYDALAVGVVIYAKESLEVRALRNDFMAACRDATLARHKQRDADTIERARAREQEKYDAGK